MRLHNASWDPVGRILREDGKRTVQYGDEQLVLDVNLATEFVPPLDEKTPFEHRVVDVDEEKETLQIPKGPKSTWLSVRRITQIN